VLGLCETPHSHFHQLPNDNAGYLTAVSRANGLQPRPLAVGPAAGAPGFFFFLFSGPHDNKTKGNETKERIYYTSPSVACVRPIKICTAQPMALGFAMAIRAQSPSSRMKSFMKSCTCKPAAAAVFSFGVSAVSTTRTLVFLGRCRPEPGGIC
jgi:hypothetical protein